MYRIDRAPGWDEFDKWVTNRDQQIGNAQAYAHTDRYYTGSSDLAANGQWDQVPGYDWCWTPAVDAGWVPYRYGNGAGNRTGDGPGSPPSLGVGRLITMAGGSPMAAGGVGGREWSRAASGLGGDPAYVSFLGFGGGVRDWPRPGSRSAQLDGYRWGRLTSFAHGGESATASTSSTSMSFMDTVGPEHWEAGPSGRTWKLLCAMGACAAPSPTFPRATLSAAVWGISNP